MELNNAIADSLHNDGKLKHITHTIGRAELVLKMIIMVTTTTKMITIL